MPQTPPTFRNALLLKLTFIVLLPIAALSLCGWILLSMAQANSRYYFRQNTANIIAFGVSERLNLAQRALDQCKASLERTLPRKALSALAQPLQASEHLQAVIYLNSSGRVEAAELRQPTNAQPSDFLGLDLSRLASSAQSRIHLSPPGTRWPFGGGRLLIFRNPIAGGGTLLGIADPDSLAADLLPASAPGGALLIGTAERLAVTQSPDISPEVHAELLRDPALPNASYASAVIPQVNWTLWYNGEPARLSRNYASLKSYSLGASSLVALAATVAAMYLARRIAQPVEKLAEASRAAVNSGLAADLPPQPLAQTEAIAGYLRHMLDTCSQQQIRQSGLRRAMSLTSFPPGQASLEDALTDLASMLASVTEARCAIIAQWLSGPKRRAQVIACRSSVRLPPEHVYELTGHPAANLVAGQTIIVASRIAEHYPESPLLRLLGAEGYIAVPLLSADGTVIGHIEVIDDHEIQVSDELRDVLLAMAGRAAGTLQQMLACQLASTMQERYQAIALDQSELTCRWTADTILTFVSGSFCQLTGKSQSDLLGQSLLSCVEEENRETLLFRSRDLSAARPIDAIELRLLNAQGERILYHWTIRAILDPKGRLIEYQGTGLSIGQMRRIEQELHDVRARFAALADNTSVAFWITDWKTQKCIYANPAFLALWGIEQEAVSQSALAWTVAIHEEDRAGVVRRYLAQAIEGQYAQTYRLIHADGSQIRIHDRAVPLRDSEGHPDRVAHIAAEIPS